MSHDNVTRQLFLINQSINGICFRHGALNIIKQNSHSLGDDMVDSARKFSKIFQNIFYLRLGIQCFHGVTIYHAVPLKCNIYIMYRLQSIAKQGKTFSGVCLSVCPSLFQFHLYLLSRTTMNATQARITK